MLLIRSIRALGSLLAVVGLVAVVIACSGESADTAPTMSGSFDEHFFNNFKKAVEDAKADGYTPYWLGKRFEAGGLTFEGPYVDDFFDGLSGGGVSFAYAASVAPSGLVTLDFAEYSPAASSEVSAFYARQPGRDVTVAGLSAKLMPAREGVRRLVVQAGDTMILVRTHAMGSTGGSDRNPLFDGETLLAVMENLRPYPQ